VGFGRARRDANTTGTENNASLLGPGSPCLVRSIEGERHQTGGEAEGCVVWSGEVEQTSPPGSFPILHYIAVVRRVQAGAAHVRRFP
jgi:hypothetical protein